MSSKVASILSLLLVNVGTCGSQKPAFFFIDYSLQCFVELGSLTKTAVCRSDGLVGQQDQGRSMSSQLLSAVIIGTPDFLYRWWGSKIKSPCSSGKYSLADLSSLISHLLSKSGVHRRLWEWHALEINAKESHPPLLREVGAGWTQNQER